MAIRSDATMDRYSEWLQLYEKSIEGQGISISSLGFSDPTNNSIHSPSNSTSSPKSGLGSPNDHESIHAVSKSPSRRSRGSKKMPTTFLKADPTNFRALVQQFTGRTAKSSARGTVLNLNFKLGRIQSRRDSCNLFSGIGDEYQHDHQLSSSHLCPGQSLWEEEKNCCTPSVDDQKVVTIGDVHNNSVSSDDTSYNTIPDNLGIGGDGEGISLDGFGFLDQCPIFEELLPNEIIYDCYV